MLKIKKHECCKVISVRRNLLEPAVSGLPHLQPEADILAPEARAAASCVSALESSNALGWDHAQYKAGLRAPVRSVECCHSRHHR